MFYIFHGDDSFSRKEQLDTLRRRYGDRSLLDLNTTELAGRGLTLAALRAACDALPFLSSVRLVLVDGFFSAKPDKAVQQAVLDYLPTLPGTVRLVFMEPEKLADNHRAVKLARDAENGYEKAFERPKEQELGRWISGRVRDKGGQIATRAAHMLAENVGSELAVLDQEIEKLVTYKGAELIQPNDVALLSPYVAEANIFDLVDALGTRNGARAAYLLQQKLNEGVDPFYLFAMFVRQFRMLLLAKESAESGLTAPAIARVVGLHPYVAGKVTQQARSFSLAQLEQVYSRLLEIDVGVKTGTTDMTTALCQLVVALGT